jgi:hypothetical protein
MSIKRAPRVAFSLNLVPRWRARVDLAKAMKLQLSKRFGRIQLYPFYLYTVSLVVLTVSGERFLIVVRKMKTSGIWVGTWEISINPWRFPFPARRFPEDEEQRYANDLFVISNEVHAVLARSPGVERLRWWFVGWESGRPGVRTPAELPWHADL